MKPPIVIVGAGPTGVTLSLLLVRRQIPVLLIEASHNFQRVFRGEGLMPSGFDALEKMDLLHLLDDVPQKPLAGWEFCIENQSIFRVAEPISPNLRSCTLVSQPAFLAAALKELQTYDNFDFLAGTGVRDLIWQDSRVAGVRLADEKEIPATLIIGADGRNSTIRQKANLTLHRNTSKFDVLWFKIADSPTLPQDNIFYAFLRNRDGFAMFRSAEGNLQIGWTLHPDDPIDWKNIDWVEKLAAASPPWLAEHFRTTGKTLERPILLSVVVGLCEKWSLPGLLLLGDAAHPMSPIRAQGINVALGDVLVASDKLGEHLVNYYRDGSPDNLAEIDRLSGEVGDDRQPEVSRIQKLQAEEVSQGETLRNSQLKRWIISHFTPLLSEFAKTIWLTRQRKIREIR